MSQEVVQGVALDASVALKLVLAEAHREQAQALLARCLEDAIPVASPPLLLGEVTNALHQRVRRQTLTQEEARAALAALVRLPIQQVQPEGLYEQALAFATTHHIRSAYDCIYVVCAQLLGLELWTADQNLLNALGQIAPWVRWIGDYQLPEPPASPA